MVEVKLTGKCAGCPSFEPVAEHLYSNDRRVQTFVMCEKQELCDRIERYLKETLNNG